MSNALESLKGLRDVDGIIGSFVVSAPGLVLLRDLPAIFTQAALAEVGPRIARLREALSHEGDVSNIVVRYEDHKLVVRGQPELAIVVLAEQGIHMPQLKMALNLVSKSLLKADLGALAGVLPSVGEVPDRAEPTVAAPAYYRGHRVS